MESFLSPNQQQTLSNAFHNSVLNASKKSENEGEATIEFSHDHSRDRALEGRLKSPHSKKPQIERQLQGLINDITNQRKFYLHRKLSPKASGSEETESATNSQIAYLQQRVRTADRTFDLNKSGESKLHSRGRSFDADLTQKVAEFIQEAAELSRFSLLQAENETLKNTINEHLQRLTKEGASNIDIRAKLVRSEVDNRNLQTQVSTLKGILQKKIEKFANSQLGKYNISLGCQLHNFIYVTRKSEKYSGIGTRNKRTEGRK